MRPCDSRHSLSNSSKTSDAGWWMTDRTVRWLCVSLRTSFIVWKADAESRPAVGRERGGEGRQ